MKYILLILFVSTLLSQSKYPVDTLVQSTKINILKKIGLLPISMWQRISYNSNYFNCQFYPSCSNYCANAIKQYGIVKGMVIGSERITRCNPFAIYYHMELDRPFYEKDGRLIDFISQNQNTKTKKSPTFASILSIFLWRFVLSSVLLASLALFSGPTQAEQGSAAGAQPFL